MRAVILNLFFVTVFLLESECNEESHYCYVTGYRSTKTCTSGWLWSRRCNYKSVSTAKLECCDDYYGDDCDKPKCGDGDMNITCDVNDEGMVIYKNGTVVTDSKGTCVAPNTCENCNEGFYPNSEVGKCKACPKIEKCNVHRCTNTEDVTCQFCHHEFNSEKLGWNEYTGLPDRKQCARK
ncbi:uncharacterized protein LOC128235442 [Mya arenaria]|uniref:uncharacterized protein LOC128235442 n=1 Tax=Mya arenaria TaxID=6604 RepID=UPI0022E08053|nr:uncharacterized protein LOC128235442 [Mya arenaria]